MGIGQGRSQDLVGGGGKNDFFQIWKFACREAMRLQGGSGACSPKIFKWCNLVHSGVYLDQILSIFCLFCLYKLKKLPFFIFFFD